MKVLLIGDTHADDGWVNGAVRRIAHDTAADVAVQLGDWGVWDGHLQRHLPYWQQLPCPTMFIDGNHENHDLLASWTENHQPNIDSNTPFDRVGIPLTDKVRYLPRGTRFSIEGVRIAALGGARSIDRGWRTAGKDWFETEAISDEDIERIRQGGHSDILLSHDTIAGYQIPGLMPRHRMPNVWKQGEKACEEHRERLSQAAAACQPKLLCHGHYHSHYRTSVNQPWGNVDIVGLSEEGRKGNMALLELQDGDWELTIVL